jgi:hypothetical protein
MTLKAKNKQCVPGNYEDIDKSTVFYLNMQWKNACILLLQKRGGGGRRREEKRRGENMNTFAKNTETEHAVLLLKLKN